MLFNSVDFFLLLAIALLLYWQSASLVWRQNCLLAASLIFYAYWFSPYLLLFLALSAAAYVGGLQIAAGRRQALTFTVILLLAILGVFKYTQFSLNLFNGLTDSLAISTVLPTINIRVPLGISFICFQLVGYLVDVARRQVPAEKSFRLFTLFIGFFPQLIAGPICRAEQLMPQLKTKQTFDSRRFASGVLLVAIGLVLKVAFADGLAPFVERVFSAESYAEVPTVLAAVSFGVQIFCDFWGYSTMAVGAAQMFGIEVPINFYLPYFSTSLREFWRRWHITLSDWFRDYLYIPLGGSRWGELMTARNLLITMTLCGLWHGAS
ncbi:MAG: MBOAT family O-acyltransferase, partial [Phormidesmis sp.]